MRTPVKTLVAALTAAIVLAPVALAGTITIKGSDTMVNMAAKWASEYSKKNPATKIQVTGGGSGTGIKSLVDGQVNLANASRQMKSKEYDSAERNGITPIEIKTSIDGLAVIVNKNNPVKRLTYQQLEAIFTGQITNWKDVGGSNSPISLYGRENSSGTYEYFREEVLEGKDYASSTKVLQGTAALADAISKDTNGIAYGGVGYFATRKDIDTVAVKKKGGYVDPIVKGQINDRAISQGIYPISRFLYVYTNGVPKGEAKQFMQWVLGPEGQKIAGEEYVPLSPATAQAELKKLEG
ncbi:PstS family phosphate ABC transporter substrate-binding protein [Candidatus Cyanaurora vandensis]|uniref:PstS family phosphate ABC transporter substrate-binding protein n=1 Tax=Candidatus Cyanaurora vandensis TaxID=2714958 RepID=UPI00257FB5B9|nr:PstS family phosphate ABC transporter substrate-binding protein [Candidatus Cyanaurora vandensis]